MLALFHDHPPEALVPAPVPPPAAALAERDRLRALRAERLARLRPAARSMAAAEDGALARFLGTLAAGPTAPPAAVLHFHRPAAPPAPACDLDRLPGVGPDLVWALTRAGVARCADIAALEPADLAARLGPIGRLVPAAAWIAAARAATAGS